MKPGERDKPGQGFGFDRRKENENGDSEQNGEGNRLGQAERPLCIKEIDRAKYGGQHQENRGNQDESGSNGQ